VVYCSRRQYQPSQVADEKAARRRAIAAARNGNEARRRHSSAQETSSRSIAQQRRHSGSGPAVTPAPAATRRGSRRTGGQQRAGSAANTRTKPPVLKVRSRSYGDDDVRLGAFGGLRRQQMAAEARGPTRRSSMESPTPTPSPLSPVAESPVHSRPNAGRAPLIARRDPELLSRAHRGGGLVRQRSGSVPDARSPLMRGGAHRRTSGSKSTMEMLLQMEGIGPRDLAKAGASAAELVQMGFSKDTLAARTDAGMPVFSLRNLRKHLAIDRRWLAEVLGADAAALSR
jgi:hypothetical protein